MNRAAHDRHPGTDTEASDGSTPAFRVSRRTLIVIAAFFALFAVYDVHSQLPTNVLRLPGEASALSGLRTIAPQGWAFFTKSPRSAVFVPYQREAAGGWHSLAAGRLANLRSHIGFDRHVRVQGEEMALLIAGAPDKAWRTCGGTFAACLVKASTSTPLAKSNASPDPTVCGQVAILSTTAVPWAYRRLTGRRRRPTRVLRMDVSC